jgi:hypothetical protein
MLSRVDGFLPMAFASRRQSSSNPVSETFDKTLGDEDAERGDPDARALSRTGIVGDVRARKLLGDPPIWSRL